MKKLTCFLLVLLWAYAAASKLLEFSEFKQQIAAQALWPWLKPLVIYLLPPVELIVAGLLLFERTIRAGWYASLLLLTAFSGYIALALLGLLNRVPCSCGGILARLSWPEHLVFNLFFLVLTFITLRKEVPRA
jgi:putative oxidoreductase